MRVAEGLKHADEAEDILVGLQAVLVEPRSPVVRAHRITVASPGFAEQVMRLVAGYPRTTVRPVTVETSVDAVQEEAVSTESVGGPKTLEAKEVRQLADDPDEFRRQLQVLAAAAGSAPGQAIIAVDGFQNSGRIPPKSAIAYIRINPDLFSAEYERPPYQGGRVEIYTKPGQSKLHGALLTTRVRPSLAQPVAGGAVSAGRLEGEQPAGAFAEAALHAAKLATYVREHCTARGPAWAPDRRQRWVLHLRTGDVLHARRRADDSGIVPS